MGSQVFNTHTSQILKTEVHHAHQSLLQTYGIVDKCQLEELQILQRAAQDCLQKLEAQPTPSNNLIITAIAYDEAILACVNRHIAIKSPPSL